MWKYEDFEGTLNELIEILEDEYQLMFYPETEDEYAGIYAYAKEATRDEMENFQNWLIAITYEGNQIIDIDSNIYVPDDYEEEEEYEEDPRLFDAIHDGSFLCD